MVLTAAHACARYQSERSPMVVVLALASGGNLVLNIGLVCVVRRMPVVVCWPCVSIGAWVWRVSDGV